MGYFEFKNVPYGKYILGFTSINSKSVFTKEFSIGSSNPNFDAGKIRVEEKIITMKEVTVTSSKMLLEAKGDKLIVNLNNSFLAAGNTISEVLQNLPGVSGSNNGLLLNNKPILILIDGKGQYNTRGVKETISTLGANQVESIEIISNPSAKYDAGVQGIINIKLKRENAYSTSRLIYGQQFFPISNVIGNGYFRLSPGLTLNYGWHKITNSTSVDYINRASFESFKEQIAISGKSDINSGGERIEKEHFLTYRSDTQFKLGTNGSIIGFTLSGFYNISNKGERNSTNYYRNVSTKELDSILYSQAINKSNGLNLNNITLYYSKKFNVNSQELDIVYDFYSRGGTTNSHFNNLGGNSDQNPSGSETILSTNGDKVDGNALNINYTNKPHESISLELGAKLTSLESSRSLLYQVFGKTITSQSLSSSYFNYNEKIVAGYSSISKRMGGTSLDGGLRIEQVVGNGKTLTSNIDIQYLKLYPYFNLNYSSKHDISYRVSWSKKIARRPSFSDLNPAIEYRTPFTILSGNPAIKPQMTNQFYFSAIIKSKYSVSAFLDIDQNIRSINPTLDENDYFRFETVNIKRGNNIGINISAPIQLNDKWSIQSNVSVNNLRITSKEYQLQTKSFYYSGYFTNDFKISSRCTFQLNASYSSPATYGFNRSGSVFTTSMSLNMFFLKKQATLNLKVNDFLGTAIYTNGSSYYNIYSQELKSVSNQRSITIRLNYNFKTGSKFTSKTKQAKSFGEIRLY